MKNAPKVTVLIPLYNGEKYLAQCLNSVLRQTYTDYECLIIDDGSSDDSLALARSFTDPRFRVVANGRNLGGGATRNRGFDLARGEYVAFFDCDDVCVPDRLEKQVAFMDAHSEVGVCGGFVHVTNQDGIPLADGICQCPTGHEAIARLLAVECTLYNPTLLVRRRVVIQNGLYHDTTYTAAEDMDWYIRLARVTQLANLPQVLTYYRRHPFQETALRRFLFRRNTINLHLGLMLEEIRQFRPGVTGRVQPVTRDMTEVTFLRNLVLVDQLLADWRVEGEAADELRMQARLRKHLRLMWLDIARCLPAYSWPVFKTVKQSAFYKSLPLAVQFRFWYKSVLGLQR